jgi:hypothetical protein
MNNGLLSLRPVPLPCRMAITTNLTEPGSDTIPPVGNSPRISADLRPPREKTCVRVERHPCLCHRWRNRQVHQYLDDRRPSLPYQTLPSFRDPAFYRLCGKDVAFGDLFDSLPLPHAGQVPDVLPDLRLVVEELAEHGEPTDFAVVLGATPGRIMEPFRPRRRHNPGPVQLQTPPV